ncbi:MAG: translocation/assembly module TamB domain-containing protein [Deltaproteobacteria bacterium]
MLLAVLALVVLVFATVNLPWVRARLGQEIGQVASKAIAGTVKITRIGHIGVGYVTGIDASLLDASGQTVVALSDSSAQLDLSTLLRSLLTDEPLTLAFERVALSEVELWLREGTRGELSLVEAFEPASKDAERDPAQSAGQSARWRFERITLKRAAVGGQLGAVDLNVDLQDTVASGRVDAESIHFDLRRADVSAVGLPTVHELEGELTGAVTLGLGAEGAPLAIDARAQWSGSVAGSPLQASARYVDERVSGSADLDVSPASLRRLWPHAAIEDPVSLFIGFEGRLERLNVRAILESTGGSLNLTGHVTLSPSLSGALSLQGLRLDAGRWLSELPESSVQLALTLHFEVEENGLEARLALRTWSTTWAGRSVPDLAVSARVTDDRGRATLRFDLPGGHAVARAALSPLRATLEETRQLDLDIEATVNNLSRLAERLGLDQRLRGEAHLEGHAHLELEGMPSIVSSHISTTLRNVRLGSVGVRSARLEVSPAGSLQSPRLSFGLNARGLSLPGYRLRSVRLQGHGKLKELALRGSIEPTTAAPARLRARLFPSEKLARDVEIVMDEEGPAKPLRLSAERLGLTPSGVDVRNLEVQGPITGRLLADISVRGSRVRAQGSAVDFSPVVLARRLGLELDVPTGVADLSFAVDYRPGHISGKLAGHLTRVCAGELRGGNLETELAVEDNVLDGLATIRVPELFEARLRASSLALPARWAPSALSRVTGELEVVAGADLAQLRTVLDPSGLTPAMGGRLRARLLFGARQAAEPRLVVSLSTQDLTASVPGSAPKPDAVRGAAGPESATWQGMDLELVADVQSSRVRAFAAILDSRRGVVAAARGTTYVSLAELLRNRQALDPRELPLDISAQIPTRRLDAFPVLPLRFDELNGSLSARLTVSGTVGRPELAGHVELTDLQLKEGGALPLTVTADATLEGERLELTAAVQKERQRLLSLLAQARVSGGGAAPAIEQLELDLRSNGLPLASLGTALGIQVAGELYGSLQVHDLPTRPTAQATLWINDPMIGGYRQDQARWVIDASAEAFSTQLELRQAEGRARTTASGPWNWSDRLVPTLEPRRTRLELEANDFDLQALRVFLPEQARALSGRLDATLALASAEERGVSGKISLREGGIYIAALGQAFHDIQLDAAVEPSGTVQIERLSARTLSGRLSARGRAELDGLMLRTAQLTGEIPRGDPLPFMFEGVTVAEASGRFNVNAQLEPQAAVGPRRWEVDVALPRFNVSLPEQAPHDVQKVEDDPTITTGIHLGSDRFLTLPIPPYEGEERSESDAPARVLNIEIQLGDEVWVKRGAQLEVKLIGNIVLQLKEELSARGEVRIARGTIDVHGRIFEIQRGVITFVEERAPSNPTVVATARYTAPEGTEVYAEFVGPVETGTLSLRSEPPLRDDQILSLLLFGTPDGNFGASTGEGGNVVGGAALAAGGTVVTQGLNQELRRFTALDIQTRIGENDGQPQPEVVVQISPRLTAELAYAMGTANPARARDRTYLTLDLRLFRNWSLSTTIGDAGSLVLELLWRYRY